MKLKSIRKLTFLILAGFISLCLLTLLILFIISGGFMKKTYLEPWDKKYALQYQDPRISLASVGLLAANNHNMQPWRIQLDKENPLVFFLYADSSRVTKEVDPLYRQMMITQGTFLEYVRLAGEKLGWKTDIMLFPAGSYDEADILHSMDTKPVAKVTLSKVKPSANPLYGVIYMADTNREAYQPKELTALQISSLEALSDNLDLSIKLFTDREQLDTIGEYAKKSAVLEAGVPRVMEESNTIFRANEAAKNKYRYGFSVEGQGKTGFAKDILQGLLTIFPSLNAGSSASQNFIQYTNTSVEHTPAYAMILSKDNSRTSQVVSGMLYSRLVLSGHRQGLVMQPLSQILEEYEEMQPLYKKFQAAYTPESGTVQMLLRVGSPTKDAPLTMRRDVQELILE